MIYVIAEMELNENCRDAVTELLGKIVPKVLSEEGCIMYTPCFDQEAGKENFVTIVEAWTSRDMLNAHLAAPHMMEFREAVKDLRKSVDVKILSPLV